MEMTFTLGEMITLVTMVMTVASFYWSIKIRLTKLEERHDDLERRLLAHEARDEKDFKEIKDNLKAGFNRIYDKLDGKEDKG